MIADAVEVVHSLEDLASCITVDRNRRIVRLAVNGGVLAGQFWSYKTPTELARELHHVWSPDWSGRRITHQLRRGDEVIAQLEVANTKEHSR